MSDEHYMQLCLNLAINGLGKVSPNPMVGCVIVHNNKIIGQGYHAKYGEAHAEVNAINDVINTFGAAANTLLKQATAYVNLEPCAHHGKTPPCADLLIKHQLKKVVIGNQDPFAAINGKGIAKLKSAGILVTTDILAQECSHFNRRFLTQINKKRPYLILKWAQTANSYFAPKDKIQKWITGPLAKQTVHLWRTQEDAILVGKNTVIADDPELTARLAEGKNPLRIVIDRYLELPFSHKAFNKAAKTIVFNEHITDVKDNVQYIQMEDMQFYLPQKIAFQLYLLDVQSVIIEGGLSTLKKFIKSNLWDEARVFTSPIEWKEGLKAPKIKTKITEEIKIGEDKLEIYFNTAAI